MAPDVDVCRKCEDNFIVSNKSVTCVVCTLKYHTACTCFKDAWLKVLSDCKNLPWVCDSCKENIVTKDNHDVNSLKKEIDCLQIVEGILENLVFKTKYSNKLQQTIIQ
nr:unnamed protein product [Callosobruchus analis]